MKSSFVRYTLKPMVFFAMMVIFLGCHREAPTPAKVAGLYAYRLSTGEIEVLSLSADMKFRHSLFRDQAAFVQGSERTFDESGEWSLDGNGIVMTMSQLFEYSHATEKERLSNPELTHGELGYWLSGNGAMIVRDEDTRYCMERIERPDDLRQYNFGVPQKIDPQ